MIKYDQGTFGFVVLFRLHGSALYKSIFPALVSSGVYVALWSATGIASSDGDDVLLQSYPVGALLASLTFILTFRVSNSYSRWWEAYTSVTMMQSKLLDVGCCLAAYHLQSSRFDAIRPPSHGFDAVTTRESPVDSNDHGRGRRTRTRTREMTMAQLQEQVRSLEPRQNRPFRDWLGRLGFTATKAPPTEGEACRDDLTTKRDATDDGWSPFLEEAAHLLSLLSAVAFSTLRNDVEGTESPLIPFDPREPFPHVDPDSYKADVRKEFASAKTSALVRVARYVLGASRTPMNRTLYNAARPFRVMGGVSDREIESLQQNPGRCSGGRGPSARVALVQGWLQEFVAREYLAGSLGSIPAPMVSILHTFVSDGMVGYHHAQKVAYVPFPFVHAQLTSFFVLVAVGIVPVLMVEYVAEAILGFLLNLFTVMSFTGLHEVARELENPFQNAPNDVPLNNFQVQFNHALLIMFRGYHPDAANKSSSSSVVV